MVAHVIDLVDFRIQSMLLASTTGSLLATFILYYLLTKRSRRASLVPPNNERVLVLGATSGIGQSIALQYAQRGASVCVVGRRQALVDDITAQCSTIAKKQCLGVCADFTDVEGLLRIREAIEKGAPPRSSGSKPQLSRPPYRMGRLGHPHHRSRRIGALAHHGRCPSPQRHGTTSRPLTQGPIETRHRAHAKDRHRRPRGQLHRPAHLRRYIRAYILCVENRYR